jgi:hypothetical protein
MSKGKYKVGKFEKSALKKFYLIKAKNGDKDIDSVKRDIQSFILTQLYNSFSIQEKINGMCWRNQIRSYTKIHQDVVQESFYELSRYNIDELFLAFCDNPNRVVALCVNITKRTGFRKMNDNVSPNQSVAKKILFASNLNKMNYISTTQDMVVFRNDTTDNTNNFNGLKDMELFEFPDYITDDDINVMEIIKSNLTDSEKEFLQIILANVFNKKIPTYPKDLRDSYMTLNEYKINLVMLKDRIREIIKNNGIKI